MANNLYISDVAADAALDAFCALFTNGYLRIYGTPQAADANTALSGQTLLAELRFNASGAFGPAAGGVAVAAAITQDSDADDTGTAVWFRCLKSDGTTVLMDGSIDTSGADMNFNTTAVQQHAAVQVTSFTVTQPEH